MLEKVIRYVDYNGKQREESFFFNLNKVETTRLEVSYKEGLERFFKKSVEEEDAGAIMTFIEELIGESYGQKTSDGKYFDKSIANTKAFKQCPAYEVLFIELLTVEGAFIDFFKQVFPQDMNL